MVCVVWGPVSEAAAQNAATLSISGPADANEGDSGTRNLAYTVSLSRQVPGDVPFEICFSGTATINRQGSWGTSGADYRTTAGGNPRGSTCESAALGANSFSSLDYPHIAIQVRGDTDVESDETVIATLSITGSARSRADITLGTSTHTHTILDDDTVALPEVTIAAGSSSVTEGDPMPASR